VEPFNGLQKERNYSTIDLSFQVVVAVEQETPLPVRLWDENYEAEKE
jgi:hypothetical protein